VLLSQGDAASARREAGRDRESRRLQATAGPAAQVWTAPAVARQFTRSATANVGREVGGRCQKICQRHMLGVSVPEPPELDDDRECDIPVTRRNEIAEGVEPDPGDGPGSLHRDIERQATMRWTGPVVNGAIAFVQLDGSPTVRVERIRNCALPSSGRLSGTPSHRSRRQGFAPRRYCAP